MFVAKVTGSVVSTEKVETMRGHKLLVVEPFRLDQSERDKLVSTGRTFIAVDMLGAGVNDYVLISQGSSARFTPETQKLPIDCAIIGIVDSVNIEKLQVYSRSEEE
ncbi:MAG: EutN/CcmL family microcompartment protein [Planctomycetota bacterium]|nr:EutN/CcmL family microcompartment protein [Planctomycetota bacterium]